MQKSIERGPSASPSTAPRDASSSVSSSLRGMDFARGEAHLAPIQAKSKSGQVQMDRKQALRKNETTIDPYRDELKTMRRRLEAIVGEARVPKVDTASFEAAVAVSEQRGQHTATVAALTAEVAQLKARFEAILAATSLSGSVSDVTPPVLSNASESLTKANRAVASANKAVQVDPVAELDELGGQAKAARDAGDHEAEHGHFEQIAKRAGKFGDAAGEVVWDEATLLARITAVPCPEPARLARVFMDVLVLPKAQADAYIEAEIDKRIRPVPGNIAAIKATSKQFVVDFKRSPGFLKARKSVTLLLANKGMSKAVESHEKQPTPMLVNPADTTFQDAFKGMASAKAGTDPTNVVQVKKALVAHLQLHVRFEAKTVDEILKEGISKKSERIRFLFDDDPSLVAQCQKLVKSQEIHATLRRIKEGGEEHSIKDVNDYVGDKLSDPLMRWVIDHGIAVEVHATSLIASFARMKSEGFTDVIEIPSKHVGTKKWVCANPKTREAKVVFQTLPGESYAIQSAGAFLFYEIYDIEPAVKAKFGAAALTAPAAPGQGSTFTHGNYKARNAIKETANSVTFLLVSPKPVKYLSAVVPFVAAKPTIGSAGEIVLGAGEAAPEIETHEVDVRSMDQDKLSIIKEDIDYQASYLDLMRSNGAAGAEIACIGRKAALVAALQTKGVTQTSEVNLPHFNMSLFELVKGAGKTKLLGFSISPEFFGEKSGHLVKALETLGVRHITFVGTAGGLMDDSEVGDVMVPKKLANFSSGKKGDAERTNQAAGLVGEMGAAGVDTAKMKSEDLHVGVHSPITESQKMIDAMKATAVSSVDCEAGFIADALKNSPGVSLYTLFYVGDVPGTHHSIGQGGVADAGAGPAAAAPAGPAPTEQALLHIIKKAIGEEIAQAAKTVKAQKYGINAGKVTGLEAGHAISVDVKLPASLKKGEDYTGALAAFVTQLNEAIGPAGTVTAEVQARVMKVVQTFRRSHGMVLLVTFG